MNDLSSTILNEWAQYLRVLKIDGCPSFPSELSSSQQSKYIASRWEIDGYEWEIRFKPIQFRDDGHCDMALQLVFLSQAQGDSVMANLSYRLVDPDENRQPSAKQFCPPKSFRRPSDSSEKLPIMTRFEAHKSGYFKNSSVTVECIVKVFKDPEEIPVLSFGLQKDLRELLRSKAGADVTFVVSGESFAAHKNVLAARSPVFMAEFYGKMKGRTHPGVSRSRKWMQPCSRPCFSSSTRTRCPNLTRRRKKMAQRLLVAADRYGLDRLKLIIARRIALSINSDTVATALALAEQHDCAQLKAKCVEFITGGSAANLHSVLATEGFKRLEASNPSVLTELLKTAFKRIKK
ncbi:hypothetical protein PR202_gb26591 [Eleusine coracana subsp. coracana]|uniref:BTB domain-containing protein n=1 Tax=Eleusine coracana subsp. coracana TaxID=191504 RepID=A0AAV5FSL1_ELECO|nr:hypothetical protein QOZ80_1BG0056650 [Eleusine coracana subsp. coracana]GJN37617.1 hypothetical protein PR202_gb26591 [Eleusine coracana subsp. coracana]